MPLPTAREINPIPDDLDGQIAEQHFFGKSLEEVEALFRESSLTYQEDLMFMGPIGFRFYVHAVIRYIKGGAATGDSDIINCIAGLLEHRLLFEAAELIPVSGPLADICAYIVGHYDKFDLSPEIYGDLRPRFELLQLQFSGQAANRGD